ncbi:UDP-glucose--hexose-1-phosphate uridylyltransferase [Flavobacterium sp. MAH-1]|uniref:Galactose-1-phosphate uridylyltransferase n=1 Tax=Flavobacterium agri TaxID=2743471 RepID=A0A7Y8Y0L4_9FLAO|nr:UDP-glucose--hexose-1-phosphate uridylyltransferase [Flavobacterium agri]NUY80381.1 UDP-glucose--hexose-1-phosphate uridylyltransferase [Flavobacterium agri]NYA70406.1 UDP-glucose--hexose-1-phosphate uridylyltransferase [Flavobacterium agri]
MREFNHNNDPHRRYNPLINEWVLVSPHRATRPWQGQTEAVNEEKRPEFDATCYLCPGNVRANGEQNPNYESTFVFDNDFAALKQEKVQFEQNPDDIFFKTQPERGISRVVCFSPRHDLTLPEMDLETIENVVKTWQFQYEDLGKIDFINHVQIFENKGAIMGCSNPHPHGQIWAQSSLPTLVQKTQHNLSEYFQKHGKTLLEDYLKQELQKNERIVIENEHFVVLVPFWAIWPFETMIVSKRPVSRITDFTTDEVSDFAKTLKKLTAKYDNVFNTSFPYSSGIHQSPTDGKSHPEWHFHMHFYPPLLRSASVKKFMVGYEMMGESQRDITPEKSAELLKSLSDVHYKSR